MSTDPHSGDVPDHDAITVGDHHASTDHGGDHGHDDHGHAASDLGPIDTTAWLAGALGVALGLVVAAGFVLATSVPAA